MKSKILFISSWFPNKLEPNNGNFVQRHAEAASLLNEVEILHAIGDASQKEKFVVDEQIINGLRTVIIYYRKTKFSFLNVLRRLSAYQKGFKLVQKPDLIHANVLQNSMLFAVWLKMRYQIPFVVTEHWSVFLKENRDNLDFTKKWMAKIIASKADYVLPVSHNLKENLEKLSIGNRYEVIGNVIDTDLFNKKEETVHSPFVFLHVSSLIALKNPEKIINAAIQLRKNNDQFELHIGGDGDIETLLEIVKMNKAEDYIKVFGALPYPKVAEKMKNADCFILFSAYENLPCVLLESISVGTPVISTQVGGVEEIVHEKNGLLIRNDEEELFQAMHKMLLENGKYNVDEMNKEIENKYSKMKIAEQFDAIYQKVLQDYQKS